MSVNVTIKEDGTARTFNNVARLSTKTPNGETTDWIPEAEANDYATTKPLSVTKNGVYNAKAHDAAGFSEVSVNVTGANTIKKEEALMDYLLTGITELALVPKIHTEATSWDWDGGTSEGTSVKTFRTSNNSHIRQYVDIQDNTVKIMMDELIPPSDYSNIAENETEYLTVDGKQVYYISISNFSQGFTMISPREYSDVSVFVEDMYKVRRLKSAGSATELMKLYSNVSEVTVNNASALNIETGAKLMNTAVISYSETQAAKTMKSTMLSEQGTEYGSIVTEDLATGTVTLTKRYNNVNYNDPLFKFYETLEAAQADIGNVAEDTVAIIRAVT